MQMLEIFVITTDHPQDVVGLPGHQMAFKDLRNVLDGSLEGIQHCLTLAGQSNLDEELHGKAKSGRIKLCAIALDISRILERLDAAMARGGREAHYFPKNLYATM